MVLGKLDFDVQSLAPQTLRVFVTQPSPSQRHTIPETRQVNIVQFLVSLTIFESPNVTP
jgi:hypothetical protein